MNLILPYFLVTLAMLCAGCSQSLTAEERVAELEAERRAQLAAVERAAALCRIDALEFGVADAVTSACWQSHSITRDATATVVALLDRQIEQARSGR